MFSGNQQPFQPGTAAGPQTQIELSVACSGLSDRDLSSKSDPCCVLYICEGAAGAFVELGRTEVVKNSLNPVFATKFQINYKFEEKQLLRFAVLDWDVSVASVSRQDALGELQCSVGEVVASLGGKFQRRLSGGRGLLLVTAEEVSACRQVLTLSLSARNLDKKDTFGKSDPFLELSRVNADGSTTLTHRTEVVKNSLSADWRPVTVPLGSLCAGDLRRLVLLRCFDWDNDGTHDEIGSCTVPVEQLLEPGCQLKLVNEKKRAKKKKYTDSGTLLVNSARIAQQVTFLDYIQSGTQLHFTVAVDFTASNGYPTDPRSLHYRDPRGGDNQYMTAIRAVGSIIQDYDTDKQFPCLGFGGRVPPDGRVSHEFFLNGHPSNPYCQGVDGILQAYYHSLNTVQLYGPTNFAPVIRHVSRIAASSPPDRDYYVLLIITDGIITDRLDTVAALVDASALPLSIIIVGVGSEDFSAMEYLDCDGGRLRDAAGRSAARDVVQFVELLPLLGRYGLGPETQAGLARAVLAELPRQLVEFMQSHGVTPNAPAPPAAQPVQ
ncbi:copine-8-like [Amphibalanus amphitrite]|uniref:copine-8-like n=1 Tax=Amphibalanus amphitrite TaxID=1232801 RepID=UPI001C8FBE77|nr:copine-8-like [Amphibalanus amphitrite]XP_043190060.1 copine-8-like [Amphibalanus amphitrite]XP_043190062.1 copine-8-like [Amphibalanus amphitrite]XP_043190063.1 copine-8-like [Amphibalanus amphitrite]XP_043190064.1 copine-8-like [Amphibalanus amphitrite]